MSNYGYQRNLLKLNEQSIPVLINEDKRLEVLYSYKLLDTDSEAYYDTFTKSLATGLNKPVAAISLVDRERVWFKSIYGVDARQIPRDPTFCSSAILSDSIYEIEDTHLINSSSVLITGDLGVRFYAGAPLVDPDGYRLGMVCVLDQVPNKLNESEREILRETAERVMEDIVLRRTIH